jgi:ribosomal protein L11 methylase PrmA
LTDTAEAASAVEGRDGGSVPAVTRHPASWRDPAGFVYRRNGVLLRQVQPSWAEEWAAFSATPLARRLVDTGRMVGWTDAPVDDAFDDTAAAVIRPEVVPFVSYPYEWTFGQLRDAALLTLEVQAAAVAADWTLKDASAYNVAFRGVTPVLIDHLSFQRLPPDSPWVAYQQFCEHFLAPLALMSRRDVRMGRMLRDQLDGIPLDLAARLLPGRSKLRLGLGAHIHLHARSQRSHAGDARKPTQVRLSRSRLSALIESLKGTVEGLRWEPSGTEWADYADKGHASYEGGTPDAKEAIVRDLLAAASPGTGHTCWDLGANTGRFSAIAAAQGYRVLAFDIDPAAAERHYRALRGVGRTDTTPVVMDLADPSPGLGWAGRERASLVDRANADVILALALVHHLGIGRNVPLAMVAEQLAAFAPQAIVEWVPRGDPMVDVLLASREDVFGDYTTEGWEAAVAPRYEVRSRTPIPGSPRVLYHLVRR